MLELRPFHALHREKPAGGWVRDGSASLVQVRQTFQAAGRPAARRGIVGALRLATSGGAALLPLEPPDPGLVRLHHERLATSRTWSTPLSVLYPGDLGDLESALALERERRPDHAGPGEDGSTIELWRVSDPALAAAVCAALAGRRGYLAEGEDWHEAGLAWARRCEVEGAPEDGPQRHALAMLMSLDDPGLMLRPLHRIVREALLPAPERLALLLDEHFEVEELPEDVGRPAGLAWVLRRVAEAGRVGHAFVIVTAADRKARLLRLREAVDLAHVAAMPRSPTLRAADTAVLHALVLRHVLGIPPGQQVPGRVDVSADPAAVVRAVLEGEAMLGALLNPPPVWLLRSVADAGELLPARTARLAPPAPAGLLATSIDPAGRF